MRIRSLLRRCLRYHTLAAAYVALVLALGGTAYAAITVTGENIVDGSITSADIGPPEVKTEFLERHRARRRPHRLVTELERSRLEGHGKRRRLQRAFAPLPAHRIRNLRQGLTDLGILRNHTGAGQSAAPRRDPRPSARSARAAR
jgi:hypothetical protein